MDVDITINDDGSIDSSMDTGIHIPDVKQMLPNIKPLTIPPAQTIVKKIGNCIIKGTLEFDSRHMNQHVNGQLSRAQIFVDSEVLRLCSPLVPFQTGMLDKSGKLGTEIGSGEVRYIAPYAAVQYYNTSESRPYDAQRGAKWFERMKAGHKKEILDGAQKIINGGK